MSLYTDASLIMYPSGYKEDKIYSLKPTDGSGDLTFTRASTATRVNAEGLIETSPVNLLLQSNTFNTDWFLNGSATLTSGQSGYDGSSDAWLLSSTAALYESIRQSVSNFGVDTFSVYAKAGTLNHIVLDIEPSAGSEAFQWFDLSGSGSIGTDLYGNVISAKIESVGGGWFRCSVTANIATAQVRIYLTQTDGVFTAVAGNIYIQDAQLNIGTTAKPYFPTTDRLNVPRIDYTGGGCGKLLLESQRSNLALQSESVTTSTTNVGYTATSNATTSPDGTQNADQILEDTGTLHLVQKEFSVGSTTDTYAVSFFVKANGRTSGKILYGLNGAPYSSISATFNLTAGTIDAATASSGATAGTSKIENYGNGWYRVSVTGVIGTAGSHYVRLEGANGGVAGDPTKGFFVWGFQAELGSYSTSYIPTTSGTAVTRLADDAYKTGISALIGQTEGTIFFDGVINGVGNPSTNIINSEKNTTWSFYVQRVTASSQINAGFIFSGTATAVVNGGTFAVGQRIKIGWAYKSGSNALYVNGTLIDSNSTTFTPPSTFDDLFLNDDTTFFGYQEAVQFNQVQLYKTRLTNAELATLTTL
jgi:hypothetical protein